MPKYTVKTSAQVGRMSDEGQLIVSLLNPGDVLVLSIEEARSMANILENPPPVKYDDPYLEAALESMRLRPDSIDCGVASVGRVNLTDDEVVRANALFVRNSVKTTEVKTTEVKKPEPETKTK